MMMTEEDVFAPDYQDDFLKPLVTAWLNRITQAEEARAPWKRLGDECNHFYEATANFLWEQSSPDKTKFWENKVTQPTFRVVIAKAFELVAQIGPSLFFRSPRRLVTPRKLNALAPEIFGDVENDPMAQQVYQSYQMELATDMQADTARAKLMETWLNYTPDQTPGGGLEEHVERAIVEALVRGRGVLWPAHYSVPGSERTLTGLFYDTVDNLFIDPDAEKLEDARWFARKRIESYRAVEERFKLPPGTLKGKATLESIYASSTARAKDVKAKDLIVYYEIFSKCGPGCDYSGLDERLSQHFDNVAGQYAYLAICSSCEYPLNVPAGALRAGATDDYVRESMTWPIPFWTGGYLPFVPLDFYPNTRSVWPMPPLAPGIGELKFLNIMVSHLCNRIWMSSRDFIAVAKSAQKEVERIIREGQDLSIIPVSDTHEDISKMIKFLDQPDVNFDAWQIIDRVAQMFDKRTGLTDLVYGLTDTQSRSAEDAATKRQATAARPDHMARKVEKWMAIASAMEGFCTRFFVKAQDVEPLIGRTAAQVWSYLIDSQDVDLVVSGMQYTVAAGSGRRRNHELELNNLNQALQFFFPEFSKHADVTTNVDALNALVQRWGDAAQIDLSDIQLGPRMPPPAEGPTPEEMEMQMKQEEHQMNMEGKQFELQVKQEEAQMKMQLEQMKLAIEQMKMELEQQKAVMKMQLEQQQAEQKIELGEQEMQFKGQEHMMDLMFQGEQHQQNIEQDRMTHDQELKQSQERGKLDMQLAKQNADQQAKIADQKAKQAAANKPKPKPKKAAA